MIFYLCFTFLCLILFILPFIINLNLKWNFNKASLFECGFDSFLMTRSPFSLRFFKLCLIFIYFDIEIILILPSPLFLHFNSMFFWVFFTIILIILLGLFFEWHQGSLNWFY
uniref:NADH-ubiquinone oxidoreductase chain 3 n=1 Tax=Hypoaspis linteyini TaxID=2695865 RepID=A0A6B9WCV6_9ACAR|nr:NADH dehydrogenase subunit 3 [Hypoaspis linteyini]QHQ98579.1 NADH dehydrogenase subunit 3 [Hypoaspis linteyini]